MNAILWAVSMIWAQACMFRLLQHMMLVCLLGCTLTRCTYTTLPVLQDAVILARKVHSLLHPQSESKGARPTSLRSVATADLVQVLRDYEKERKSRTRLITIRSNLMGQALQIPFAPVSNPGPLPQLLVAQTCTGLHYCWAIDVAVVATCTVTKHTFIILCDCCRYVQYGILWSKTFILPGIFWIMQTMTVEA